VVTAGRLLRALAAAAILLSLVLVPGRPPRVPDRHKERRPAAAVSGVEGARIRLAVSPFVEIEGQRDIAAVATEVLRQDLEFEGAFDVLPPLAGPEPAPAEASVVPADLSVLDGRGIAALPRELADWERLGADGLVTGAIRRGASGEPVEIHVRVYAVKARAEAFARGYLAPPAQARLAAHAIADELHQAIAGVRGIARTRLAFVSDRGGLRRELGGLMRPFKEIWIADYDGTNERRVTFDVDMDITPAWSPDGRAIAYTSSRGASQDILVTIPGERRAENITRGLGGRNYLPSWSPDGARIAFTSGRDGNAEIYAMNRDGSGVRRLTRHWAIDTSPAWSPDGGRIAFTSDRTGRPQIWVMNADGSDARALTAERHSDRPTWSTAPYDEIAYVARTKTGYDIKTLDLRTGESRQLTFGEGFNESPAYSPNGRHIAFSSSRRGGQQVWIISRDGSLLRQVTRIGHNTMPAWR
jgi:TolB protein